MEKQIEKFLSVMSPDVPIIFRAISKEGLVSTISKEYIKGMKKDHNIYFLGGLNKTAERMTDNDLSVIHYIRLDIDIKKGIKEAFSAEADSGDILGYIEEIKEAINTDEFLKERSYIVFSGGGCHIYYSNKTGVIINKDLTTKIWQLAMKRIYNLFDSTIIKVQGKEYNYIKADKAVCNTARIMRLPGTINQKMNEECTIVYEEPDRQSRLLSLVKPLGMKSMQEIDSINKKRANEILELRDKIKREGGEETDLRYQLINKIPAYLIAQMLIPDFPYDGKKNFKNKEGGFTGYYYVDETNSICNGGSRYFNWGETESCWNAFSLVKRHLGLNDHETFTFFEEKFNL